MSVAVAAASRRARISRYISQFLHVLAEHATQVILLMYQIWDIIPGPEGTEPISAFDPDGEMRSKADDGRLSAQTCRL
jgi:hypothetical protein